MPVKEPTTQDLVKTVEQELKQTALTVIERAKLVRIVDQGSYDQAASLLADEIHPIRKRWAAYWRGENGDSGPISLAYKAYKSLMDKFNEGEKPLKDAEESVVNAIRRWDAEQKRLLEEKQRQAQLKAEEEARIEREKQAEFAAMSGMDEAEVQAIATAPVAVVAAPVEPVYERRKGLPFKTLPWRARVTSLKKLCAAIGAGKAPETFVEPNQTALNKRADSDKVAMNVPGVVAYDPNVTGTK